MSYFLIKEDVSLILSKRIQTQFNCINGDLMNISKKKKLLTWARSHQFIWPALNWSQLQNCSLINAIIIFKPSQRNTLTVWDTAVAPIWTDFQNRKQPTRQGISLEFPEIKCWFCCPLVNKALPFLLLTKASPHHSAQLDHLLDIPLSLHSHIGAYLWSPTSALDYLCY